MQRAKDEFLDLLSLFKIRWLKKLWVLLEFEDNWQNILVLVLDVTATCVLFCTHLVNIRLLINFDLGPLLKGESGEVV